MFTCIMLVLLQLLGCKTTVENYYTEVYEGPEIDDTSWIAGEPDCPFPVDLNEIEVFEQDGVTIYLQLLEDQVQLMDERACSGGYDWYSYGTYELGDEEDVQCPTYVEQAWLLTPERELCAATGKVELTTFGESSFQHWMNPDDGSFGIPNLRFDFGEFHSQKLADGTSHLRLSNGQAESGIIRLDIAARIWLAMGYPAPRTSFVQVLTDMWDNLLSQGAWAAYTAFEPYKKNWVRWVNIGITSIWEGVGDPLWDLSSLECWWAEEECEDSRLDDIVSQLNAPHTDLMSETVGLVDWQRLHENLCLTNLTGTWDNWSHNGNNVVIALGPDGILLLLYSGDISGGHPWYPEMQSYWGWSSISQMCAQDEYCRSQAIDTCLTMVDQFETMGLATIASDRCEALESAGLAREPDAAICEQVEEFYLTQPTILRERLLAMQAGEVFDTGWMWETGLGHTGELIDTQ